MSYDYLWLYSSIPPSGPPPRLSSANKGAQLLAKMGWQGGGLGAERQVIRS